jgi:hypothetical protein
LFYICLIHLSALSVIFEAAKNNHAVLLIWHAFPALLSRFAKQEFFFLGAM